MNIFRWKGSSTSKKLRMLVDQCFYTLFELPFCIKEGDGLPLYEVLFILSIADDWFLTIANLPKKVFVVLTTVWSLEDSIFTLLLGLDLVPRKGSAQVDPDAIAAVKLYHIHHDSMEKTCTLHMDNSFVCIANNSEYYEIRIQQKLYRSFRHTENVSITPRILAYHLYLRYQSFQCNVGEDTEIQLALFDNKTNQFYSEKFIVRLTKEGIPKDNLKSSDLSTLLIDLGTKDLNRETYLVARVFRIGSLREGEIPKVPSAFRRPYGCGVLNISHIMEVNTETDPLGMKDLEIKIDVCGESDFATLHENLIRKQVSKSILPAGPSGSKTWSRRSSASTWWTTDMQLPPDTKSHFGKINVSLRLFCGDLQSVKKAEPVLLKSCAITRKMGFSDVIMPGNVRNDMYVTLSKGEFERGSKTAQRNIEVKATPINADGEVITVTIPMKINSCRGSHIRFEFRHCSSRGRERLDKKLFSFGFIKLVTEDGTTICDGPHELFLYKCEEPKRLHSFKAYISLPSCTSEINPGFPPPQGNTFFKRSERESVVVTTLLCSTKLTQNADLLGLLKWKDNPERVDDNLEKLMNLDGEEIVKYLQDIMDALFNMFSFDDANKIPQSQSVFKALVYIFNILYDPKFEHFQPVMDAYISGHFSAVLVYKDLLICLKEILDAVSAAITAPSVQQPFQRCFRVLEYTSKCIVQSRRLYKQAFSANDDTQFTELLKDVFDNMGQVLSLESDVVIITQSVLLDLLPKSLIQFARIHPKPELSQALCKIINRMPRAMDGTSMLYGVKLRCLIEIVNSPFFDCEESKVILLPLCMGQLKRHLIHKQEMSLCATMLGDILSILHEDISMKIPTDSNIQTVTSSLLEVVITTTLDMYGERTKTKVKFKVKPVRGLLVACLTDMLRLMKEHHYKFILTNLKDKKPLREFMNRLLQLFSALIRRSAFPNDWLVMKMVLNKTILTAIEYVAEKMCERFLQGSDFDGGLWTTYFNLAVTFLTQPCLQLESFSQAKCQMFLHKYGDMRVTMGNKILSMWESLDEHKLHFVPDMVSQILEVTLVPETELRKATLPILFDMMKCEQKAEGSFRRVETELLDHLDILVNSHKGDPEYKQLFNTVLLEKVQTEASWQEAGSNFIQSITKLLERLLDYRNVLEGEENTEKRMTCTMNLLNFYKHEVDHHQMYMRYLYKLKELHLQSSNHTEAAFTLLLHAKVLDWTDQLLPEEENFPMEYSWSRKEKLYDEIIRLFDLGKTWEYGIPLCKELAEFYERRIQYDRLSKVLEKQAQFYNNILYTLRLGPGYFRVGFYGQNFPLFVRNREFVYRGHPLERLASFQEHLLSEFNGAKILTSINSPGEDIRQGLQQCILNFLSHISDIQIWPVRPLPDINSDFLESDVPMNVRNFYKVNQVDIFQLDRPYHVGTKDDNNEFKTLHIERVTMRIAEKLPGILRWFEILEHQTVLLSPIQVAIDSMERKNSELHVLTDSYKERRMSDVRSLTMNLSGTIDAAVSGGFSKYQEAFFNPEFAEQPENSEAVNRLKALFLDQLQILEHGLEIHSQLISPDMRELHKRLVELYKRMKRGIQDSGSPTGSRLDMLLSTPMNEKRASQISSSSSMSSSTYTSTSTPPGSNRSSGVYSECAEISGSQQDSNGFLSEAISGGSRTIIKKPVDIKFHNDPGMTTRESTPSLNSVTSSASLDSGIGHPGQTHRRSKTMNIPSAKDVQKPALPPRKASLSAMEATTRDSSPMRTLATGDRYASSNRKLISKSSEPVIQIMKEEQPPPIPPKRSTSNPGSDGGFVKGTVSPPATSVIHSPGTDSASQTPTRRDGPAVTHRHPPPIPERRSVTSAKLTPSH
ncbi:hypothetical protein LSH36_85g03072 [Paralvinella palmiformis]|uniref:Dedicator of cytokinesis protein 3 n=1 Tax=Paralvinella palmiformis TaxID=53620 RepID=A0AAD9K1C8_9ANNE|nr:hypothetical protein LSH36_85g03072 [Paralvinella palmiformis]